MGCKAVIETEVFDPGISIFFASDVHDPPVKKTNASSNNAYNFFCILHLRILRYKNQVFLNI